MTHGTSSKVGRLLSASVTGALLLFAVVLVSGSGTPVSSLEITATDATTRESDGDSAAFEASLTAEEALFSHAMLAAGGVPLTGPDAVVAAALGLGTTASSLVAAYAPVAIDSLPLHRPERADQDWHTGPDLTVVTKGMIRAGQSLSGALRRQGIRSSTIALIVREMRPVFDFRRARPGDRYRLAQDVDGNVLDFRYSRSPEKSYHLASQGGRYQAREDVAKLQAQVANVAGVVESSLYDAIKGLGEKTQLASDLANIFAWDIDFSRSVRPGDDFQILYERLYRSNEDGEEVYIKPGRILAARYRGGVGDHAVVYFENEGGRGGYYRPDGTAIERAFLLAPLEYSRISSSFSTARRHPILNVVRPHRGIDYAAARGTPLWSVAAGTVIFRGWAGASGNLVKIKHANGYISYYAHLARFEQGLRVGDRVGQRQVIGFVGDSGLATGPHVCFRIQQNGRYVNPLDIAIPAGESIERRAWTSFRQRRDMLLSDLGGGSLVAADEAL